jgi:hypothetical protein
MPITVLDYYRTRTVLHVSSNSFNLSASGSIFAMAVTLILYILIPANSMPNPMGLTLPDGVHGPYIPSGTYHIC